MCARGNIFPWHIKLHSHLLNICLVSKSLKNIIINLTKLAIYLKALVIVFCAASVEGSIKIFTSLREGQALVRAFN